MKDSGPRYDSAVARVLGWNPNEPISVVQDAPPQPTTDSKPVNFEIGLEFERRMKKQLEGNDEIYDFNSRHLLAITARGGTIRRTYYNYLPGMPPHAQEFKPVQELRFVRGRHGKYRLAGIHLKTTHPDRIWKELSIDTDTDKTTIEAIGKRNGTDLRIEYPKDTPHPLVFLNGSDQPFADQEPVFEGDSEFFVYEQFPSSAILPAQYQAGLVAIHMSLDRDLTQYPTRWDDTSDKGIHNLKDPLKEARILWIP